MPMPPVDVAPVVAQGARQGFNPLDFVSGGLGLISGVLQAGSARRAAREQMAFQERMRSTQYQTAVEDMRKAGLNPALAYDQGGAGTPSGSQAEAPNIGAAAISSALEARRLREDVATMRQQRLLIQQQGVKAGEEAQTIRDLRPYQVDSAKAGASGAEMGLTERKAIADWWKKVGSTGKGVQFLMPLLRILLGGR